MKQTEWVSPTEAGKRLGLCNQTIRKMCKDGRLVSSKIGYRTIRISTASIEKFLNDNKQQCNISRKESSHATSRRAV